MMQLCAFRDARGPMKLSYQEGVDTKNTRELRDPASIRYWPGFSREFSPIHEEIRRRPVESVQLLLDTRRWHKYKSCLLTETLEQRFLERQLKQA